MINVPANLTNAQFLILNAHPKERLQQVRTVFLG
jgi:hypothetical protein